MMFTCFEMCFDHVLFARQEMAAAEERHNATVQSCRQEASAGLITAMEALEAHRTEVTDKLKEPQPVTR